MKKKLLFVFITGVMLGFSAVLINYFVFTPAINSSQQVIQVLEEMSTEEWNELLAEGKQEYYRGNLDSAINIYERLLNTTYDKKEPLKNLYYINKEMGDYGESNYYLKYLIKKRKIIMSGNINMV